MRAITLKKGETVAEVFNGLKIKLSRSLDKTMILVFMTPAQHKKAEITKRTNIQNKAIWMVCNDISKNTGIGKAEDFYFDFKMSFLTPEIAQDDTEYAGLRLRADTLKTVMDDTEWRYHMNNLFSGSDATPKQFSKAFDRFCNTQSSAGVQFRHPEDYQLMLQEKFYQDLIN